MCAIILRTLDHDEQKWIFKRTASHDSMEKFQHESLQIERLRKRNKQFVDLGLKALDGYMLKYIIVKSSHCSDQKKLADSSLIFLGDIVTKGMSLATIGESMISLKVAAAKKV